MAFHTEVIAFLYGYVLISSVPDSQVSAASGALIITTKKGTTGTQKMKIDFNSSASWSSANKLPDLQTRYAQGSAGVYAGPTGDANARRVT